MFNPLWNPLRLNLLICAKGAGFGICFQTLSAVKYTPREEAWTYAGHPSGSSAPGGASLTHDFPVSNLSQGVSGWWMGRLQLIDRNILWQKKSLNVIKNLLAWVRNCTLCFICLFYPFFIFIKYFLLL